MASLRDVTIYAFEAAWTDGFKNEDGFLPQASILPYLRALSDNGGCQILYRQIRTEEDFKTWTKGIKGSRKSRRIIWLAGHGETIQNGKEIQIRMPDYRKTSHGNRLSPKTIHDWLERAGKIDGVIVDSCNFGNNAPDQWLPNNVWWGLTYRASVNWTESIFFGLKAIEWLYERNAHPKSSEEAAKFFLSGVKTGGYKKKTEQFSLVEFGASLKQTSTIR